MARGHRLNTSIVLAAVHCLSGLFGAFSAVEPSLFRPLPTLSPSLISHLASVDVKQNGPTEVTTWWTNLGERTSCPARIMELRSFSKSSRDGASTTSGGSELQVSAAVCALLQTCACTWASPTPRASSGTTVAARCVSVRMPRQASTGARTGENSKETMSI